MMVRRATTPVCIAVRHAGRSVLPDINTVCNLQATATAPQLIWSLVTDCHRTSVVIKNCQSLTLSLLSRIFEAVASTYPLKPGKSQPKTHRRCYVNSGGVTICFFLRIHVALPVLCTPLRRMSRSIACKDLLWILTLYNLNYTKSDALRITLRNWALLGRAAKKLK